MKQFNCGLDFKLTFLHCNTEVADKLQVALNLSHTYMLINKGQECPAFLMCSYIQPETSTNESLCHYGQELVAKLASCVSSGTFTIYTKDNTINKKWKVIMQINIGPVYELPI